MFSARDPLLNRWFKAQSEEALKAMMNHPRVVSWRRSVVDRKERNDRLNALYGPEQILMARAKREWRQYKRRNRGQLRLIRSNIQPYQGALPQHG